VRSVEPKSEYPRSSLELGFSSSVSPDIAADYISVDPKVNYSVKRIGNDIILTGDFVPGSKYQLTIAKGLPALDDAVLREDYKKEVQFADLTPKLEFESPGMFLDSKGTQAVVLKSINTESVELTVDRVYLNNIFFLFQSYGYSVWRDEFYQGTVGDFMGGRVSEELDYKIANKKNQEVSTVLDLRKYIPEDEPALSGRRSPREYQGCKVGSHHRHRYSTKKGKDDFLSGPRRFLISRPLRERMSGSSAARTSSSRGRRTGRAYSERGSHRNSSTTNLYGDRPEGLRFQLPHSG
jgi:hypothetical protein